MELCCVQLLAGFYAADQDAARNFMSVPSVTLIQLLCRSQVDRPLRIEVETLPTNRKFALVSGFVPKCYKLSPILVAYVSMLGNGMELPTFCQLTCIIHIQRASICPTSSLHHHALVIVIIAFGRLLRFNDYFPLTYTCYRELHT